MSHLEHREGLRLHSRLLIHADLALLHLVETSLCREVERRPEIAGLAWMQPAVALETMISQCDVVSLFCGSLRPV